MKCKCGCGIECRKLFVSGHNRKGIIMSKEQKYKIGIANKLEYIKIKCIFCSQIFEVMPYRKTTALYCSLSCKSKSIYDPDKFTMKGRVAWNKGILGLKHSEATIQKIIKGLIGRPKTEKTRKLLSLAMTGKKHSEETIMKLASYRREQKSSWKGGKSFEKYTLEWNNKLKQEIRDRDNDSCQICGKHSSLFNIKLHVHHIDYNKKSCSNDNLITLCIHCHMKTNKNRALWERYISHRMIVGADALLLAEFGGRITNENKIR